MSEEELLQELDEKLRQLSVEGLWSEASDADMATYSKNPHTTVLPHVWKWQDLYDAIQTVGNMHGLDGKAERRVLRLINVGAVIPPHRLYSARAPIHPKRPYSLTRPVVPPDGSFVFGDISATPLDEIGFRAPRLRPCSPLQLRHVGMRIGRKSLQFYGILSISGLRQGCRLDNVKFSTKYMCHV